MGLALLFSYCPRHCRQRWYSFHSPIRSPIQSPIHSPFHCSFVRADGLGVLIRGDTPLCNRGCLTVGSSVMVGPISDTRWECYAHSITKDRVTIWITKRHSESNNDHI
jgi:hypothetical protein